MTDHTEAVDQANHVAAKIEKFATQISSGQYGNLWTVSDHNGYEYEVVADTAQDAIDEIWDRTDYSGEYFSDWYAERVPFGAPTIVDEQGNQTDISDYVLEVVDQRGREFAVVLTVGGPHIEVAADGNNRARLELYWASQRVTIRGDYFDTFLDWFIGRELD